jgi:hypothetical protein
MKAISIRAPFWWFILHGGKDIENRDWSTRYRGPLLIHASKWWDAVDGRADLDFCRDLAPDAKPVLVAMLRLRGGHIVGKVDLVDCVDRSDSPWFFGRYGFVLANPVAFETPISFKGALGLFNVPDGTVPE